jgi:hypothetical protein
MTAITPDEVFRRALASFRARADHSPHSDQRCTAPG